MKKMKTLLAVLMAISLCMGLMSVNVFADDTTTEPPRNAQRRGPSL